MSGDSALTMFVRPAHPGDVDVIADLLNAVRSELAEERGADTFYASEVRPEPFATGLADDLADPNAHIAVAGIDGVVLGVAVSRLRATHAGATVSRVEELVVDRHARGIGIGVSLLDEATAWAQDQGASGIESFALPGQRATKNFFEAAGMKARLLTVHRSFNPPPKTSDDADNTGGDQ